MDCSTCHWGVYYPPVPAAPELGQAFETEYWDCPLDTCNWTPRLDEDILEAAILADLEEER